MKHLLALVLVGLTCTACAGDSGTPAAPVPVPCAASDGFLSAQLRGALTHDISWKGADLQCEGGPRPEGKGLRLTFAGPLPATGDAGNAPPRQLRFIFGIDLDDAAAGEARVLPTNITVIVEGAQQLFATRGDDRCAIESLERQPLPGTQREQVRARGYCISPAVDLASDTTLLIPTFEFTGVVATGADP